MIRSGLLEVALACLLVLLVAGETWAGLATDQLKGAIDRVVKTIDDPAYKGEDKATALKAIFEGPYEPDQLPAQLINPTDGRLVWLLDRAAAQVLDVIGS